ncbi:MAG: MaoC family dehydratase N-terminal domain-containing protein [Spirochaetales bacterium]|jgi:acyl dehydratase|nr:MaoC family dehydratase N-terminal domain-containing protein [Spirochaetales bacterium]
MAIDLSYKGREIASYTFEVDRSKIRELCAAIGDPNPVFTDPEAAKKEGYADTPAPLTFATLITFGGCPGIWERMTEMGIDIKRLLHAKEEYEYLAPIYPGDKLTGLITVEALRGGAMEMAAFRTTYTRGGETVLVSRMTIIVPPAAK